MYDTVITFGTFDHFHSLHKRLIDNAFKIGKHLIVYVYDKDNKRKGNTRIVLTDSVQTRITNVTKYALTVSRNVFVKKKTTSHLQELKKAIQRFKNDGSVVVFGGEDQLEYQTIVDLCNSLDTMIITIPRGDSKLLCSSDIRNKLSYKTIINNYNLDISHISNKLWKTPITNINQAKEYLQSIKYLDDTTAQIWKYNPDSKLDIRLTQPIKPLSKIVICLPGRKKCDLDRIRKIMLLMFKC